MGQSNSHVFRLLFRRTTASWGFRVGAVLAAFCTFGALLVLASVRSSARGTGGAPDALAISAIPGLFARAMAWGACTLTAFATQHRIFFRDHEDGIRGLLGAFRKDHVYLRTRLTVAFVTCAALCVTCTFVVSLACSLAALGGKDAGLALSRSVSALVYSALFSCTLGPVALAVLGGRSRAGGYIGLLLALALPEWIEPSIKRTLPREIEWLPLSVPSAIDACSQPSSVGTCVGSLSILLLMGILAYTYTKREARRVDAELLAQGGA